MRNIKVLGLSGLANQAKAGLDVLGASALAGIGFGLTRRDPVPLYGRFDQTTGTPVGMRFGRSLIWPIKDGGLGATQAYVPAPIINAVLLAIAEIGGSAAGSVTINADETEGRILFGSAVGQATVTITVSGPGRISANVVIGFQPSADDIAFTLLDTFEVESGLTVRQALKLIAAATAGKLSGAGTTTVTIRSAVADDADRIVATVDSVGNRTAVAVSVS